MTLNTILNSPSKLVWTVPGLIQFAVTPVKTLMFWKIKQQKTNHWNHIIIT